MARRIALSVALIAGACTPAPAQHRGGDAVRSPGPKSQRALVGPTSLDAVPATPPTTPMDPPSSTIVQAARPPSSRRVAAAPGPGDGAADHDVKEHGGDVWEALARCESGMRPGLRNPPYSGAFQFISSTWRSLGESGEAADHSYEHQRAAAIRLQARSGWGQWPACSRKLGLR